MRFICDEKEGWTPVIGKRSRHKVPTRLLRLRAPPHVRARLPSSDSSAGETSDSDCSLHIPDGVDVCYSPLNDRVFVLAHAYSCVLCVSCNLITRIIIKNKKKGGI